MDNSQDMVSKGRHAYGEKSVRALLTEDNVIAIRAMAARGIYHKDIAVIFGVSMPAVGAVVRRTNWKHVP